MDYQEFCKQADAHIAQHMPHLEQMHADYARDSAGGGWSDSESKRKKGATPGNPRSAAVLRMKEEGEWGQGE